MGPGSLRNLRETAREASLYGRASSMAGQFTKRWRADMELALAYAQADAMLAARGALPTVAGPQFYPIGRMLRPGTAACGEHRQRDAP